MNMEYESNKFVPALRFHFLTGVYDRVVALTTRERFFKQCLLEQAPIGDKTKVLDVGCGTGTLAIMAKDLYPDAVISGLDGDPEMLRQANKKSSHAGTEIRFTVGMSTDIPHDSNEFDIVLSTLFFHHLTPQNKNRTLNEILRVLKPGGELHICDWGRPTNFLLRSTFLLVRCLDGFLVTRDNVAGRLPTMIKAAGFSEVQITRRISTMLGTLDLITAK